MPPPLGEVDSGPQDRRRRGRLRRIGLLYPARRNSPQIAKSLLHPQGSCSNPRRTALSVSFAASSWNGSWILSNCPPDSSTPRGGAFAPVPALKGTKPRQARPAGGRASCTARQEISGSLTQAARSTARKSPQTREKGSRGRKPLSPWCSFPHFSREMGPRRRRPLKGRGKPSR